MKKRILLLLLALMFVFCLAFPQNAHAYDLGVVTPQWTYLNVVSTMLEINNSGLAIMSSEMNCSSAITKVVMSNYLQRYINGAWTSLASWSQTTYDNVAFWSKEYYVYQGYNYRLRTFFYAYQGSTVSESTYLTTSIQSY